MRVSFENGKAEHRMSAIKDNTYGIADLQEKLLEILSEFIRVCEENDLTYWACGGTCLGALRHDGFIPWDDDLDVFMPRPDYERLWTLRNKFREDRYKLCRTTRDKNYHHRVQQLVDINTTFINQRSVDEDIEHGVYIDILPMDGCAPTAFTRLKQMVCSSVFSIYNVQCLPEFHGGRLFRAAVGAALALIRNQDQRYRIWRSCEMKMTAWDWKTCRQARELTASFRVLLHPYPMEWFAGVEKHRFENIEINIPVGADAYLRQVYGDYMELPPEDERHIQHNTVKIDLHNSYLAYKGKLYCRETDHS